MLPITGWISCRCRIEAFSWVRARPQTSWPARRNAEATLNPMYPVAPVTKTFIAVPPCPGAPAIGRSGDPIAQRLDHPADVSRLPVYPAARGAARKALLRPENVGRHLAADGAGEHQTRAPVAPHAAAEEGALADPQPPLLQDLANLRLELLAADEDMIARGAALREPAVAGQDRPPLPDRESDQVLVLDAREVDDVVAEEDQPFRERPEHAVGSELHVDAPLMLMPRWSNGPGHPIYNPCGSRGG